MGRRERHGSQHAHQALNRPVPPVRMLLVNSGACVTAVSKTRLWS